MHVWSRFERIFDFTQSNFRSSASFAFHFEQQKTSMEAFVGRNITCMKGGKTLFAHRWIKMKRTRNLFFNQTYYTWFQDKSWHDSTSRFLFSLSSHKGPSSGVGWNLTRHVIPKEFYVNKKMKPQNEHLHLIFVRSHIVSHFVITSKS